MVEMRMCRRQQYVEMLRISLLILQWSVVAFLGGGERMSSEKDATSTQKF